MYPPAFSKPPHSLSGRGGSGWLQNDDPPPGGFGEWVRDHSLEFNGRSLGPRHASFIAAILVHEGKIRSRREGNAKATQSYYSFELLRKGGAFCSGW